MLYIISQGYISYNPASNAKTIKEERFTAEFLNNNQINELLALFDNSPIKLAVELCCIYGFRRSEVLGLKWHNIDFENKSIRICETLQQTTKTTMLANSEFIVMLNQASTDRDELAHLLNISELQLSYITNSEAGHGLIKVGSALVPFANKFPTDTKLYRLMTTKPGESSVA